ncbi:MAG TPA: Sec-independent protein translocase protein TatB [Candidatus Corynebacterium avicola]|uniref:Sec-independent protein translocase protein TatB n=1 Tax=Candidatus Corynebacterium avicola TaxID=2838527 RepID=A0A9D1RN60_9CORY|nr:Sec-independent protein translocase protein TatB [Candidatus Corynebacterium avicola]
MFSNIGWFEVLIILVVGIVVVGPERLPRMINDVKALLLAARRTIANARKEFDDDFGEDLEEFRKPLEQLNSVRQMGARGFITKTLLDDDDSMLTDLESSAREVTTAAKGTADAVRHPGRTLRSQVQEDYRADKDRKAEERRQAELKSEKSDSDATAVAGDAGASDIAADQPSATPAASAEPEAAQESRVEVPQQDEAGASRDWSNPAGFDEAM